MQYDGHFLTACRYMEANALRARLVGRAEDWPWPSAATAPRADRPPLTPCPVERTADWLEWVNAPRPDDVVAEVGRR